MSTSRYKGRSGIFALLLAISIILAPVSVTAFSFSDFLDDRIYYKQSASVGTAVYSEPTYTLGFVGDIMLDRSVRKKAEELHGGEYRPFFVRLEEQLKSYDILFGNLEGPASDKGVDQGSLYSFRMDPLALETLDAIGFDILSMANNHALDWGREALVDTYNRINESDMVSVGGGRNITEAHTPRTKTLPDGTTVAYLAFSQFGTGYMEASDTSAGIALIDREFIKAALRLMKRNVDIIVVSFHFGEEYETLPNAYQEEIAKLTIDAGADIVVGHHAHVIQPLQKYKGGYIAYGLGNFIFDQGFSTETMTGGILNIEIKKGAIENAFIQSTYQDPNYTIHELDT